MYTLRIFTETSEINNWLGSQYEIVMREESYDKFKELFKSHFEKDHVADLDPTSTEATQRCYAFVLNEKKETIPVFKGQKNYIVTVGGKTFSNLTYK
jgi:hypothetical protein